MNLATDFDPFDKAEVERHTKCLENNLWTGREASKPLLTIMSRPTDYVSIHKCMLMKITYLERIPRAGPHRWAKLHFRYNILECHQMLRLCNWIRSLSNTLCPSQASLGEIWQVNWNKVKLLLQIILTWLTSPTRWIPVCTATTLAPQCWTW